MRQSLLFGGLSSVSWNINRQNPDLKLYEFGNTYFHKKSGNSFPRAGDYIEKKSLDIFITGCIGPQSWNYKSNPSDFFNIKSAVEMVLSRLGIIPEDLSKGDSNKKYFSESFTWSFNNIPVASAGKISKGYLAKFDIGQEVYYGHIEWDHLLQMVKEHAVTYSELPKYPWVRRDLALLLDKSVKFGQIRELAFKTEKHILRDVDLFDVYENESLGNNKKSYAVSFILLDKMKTLTDKSIEKTMNSLAAVLEKELGAKIR
jgi:phenylalanyl-tRNA synthetase beta chain